MAAENYTSGPTADSYIGSLISLTSKSEIRYEGVVSQVDTQGSTIALLNVRSFGTEGRRKDGLTVKRSDKVYEYIIFRGSDIKDLQVISSPPAIENDPVIIQTNLPLHQPGGNNLGPSCGSSPQIPQMYWPAYYNHQPFLQPPAGMPASDLSFYSAPARPPLAPGQLIQSEPAQVSTTLIREGQTGATFQTNLPLCQPQNPQMYSPAYYNHQSLLQLPDGIPLQYPNSTDSLTSSSKPLSNLVSHPLSGQLFQSKPAQESTRMTVERNAPATAEAQPPNFPSAADPHAWQKPNEAPYQARLEKRDNWRGRGYENSQPAINFNEEFDFMAMNAKFNKEEVWSNLGKSNKHNHEDELIAGVPKTENKPVYSRDDFFDTLSSDSFDNRSNYGGRTRFSEQMNIDSEMFNQRHRGGWRGRVRGGHNGGNNYGVIGRGHGKPRFLD